MKKENLKKCFQRSWLFVAILAIGISGCKKEGSLDSFNYEQNKSAKIALASTTNNVGKVQGVESDTVKRAVLSLQAVLPASKSKVTTNSSGTPPLSPPPVFVATVLMSSSGFATVTLDATVKYTDDYRVRATVYDIHTSNNVVYFSVSYVYTRNGETTAFSVTHGDYSSAPF